MVLSAFRYSLRCFRLQFVFLAHRAKSANRLFLLFAVLGFASCHAAATGYDTAPILYLGWEDGGRTQLFRLDSNKEPVKLTDLQAAVHDYAPSPDGRRIVVSTQDAQDGSEIWVMNSDGSQQSKLFTCELAECGNFDWAPDSRRLLFERLPVHSAGPAGAASLWWIDTDTADTRPLLAENGRLSTNGRISSDGKWVSYHSPEDEGLMIYNLEDGRSHFVLNEIGTAAAWSPTGSRLVVPKLDLVILHGEEGDDHETHEHEYETAVHLTSIDVETGEQRSLSGDLNTEDNVPALSPDGQWIAFGRRAPGTNAARQIWIMRADGSEARALTNDPMINYGPPSWSADGEALLFQRIRHDQPSSEPAIWRFDIRTGTEEELATSGMQPAWLPPDR